MKKIIAIIIVLTLQAFGQNTYEFLRIDATARSASLGGAFAANVDDPGVIFYNPAGVNYVEDNLFTIGFTKHLLDVNSGYLSYTSSLPSIGKIGFGLMFTNYGSFDLLDEFGYSSGSFTANDFAILGNYSYNPSKNLSYGFNLKFIYSAIHTYSSYAISSDFGLSYLYPEKGFSAGFSILNFGQQLKSYSQIKEKLPLDLRIGMTKKLEHTPFRIYLEFIKLNEKSSSFTSRFKNFILGLEIQSSDVLTFRLGFNSEKRREMKIGTTVGTEGFNIGFGVKVDKYRFDYGLSSFGKIGSIHRINLTTRF